MKYENEIMPYKKKSCRRPPTKSKHKHDFKPCVFEFEFKTFDIEHGYIPTLCTIFGTYCVICGKIGDQGGLINKFDYSDRTMLPKFHLNDWLRQKHVKMEEAYGIGSDHR